MNLIVSIQDIFNLLNSNLNDWIFLEAVLVQQNARILFSNFRVKEFSLQWFTLVSTGR